MCGRLQIAVALAFLVVFLSLSNGQNACEEICVDQVCRFGFSSAGCPRCKCARDPCLDLHCGAGHRCIRVQQNCQFSRGCPQGARCMQIAGPVTPPTLPPTLPATCERICKLSNGTDKQCDFGFRSKGCPRCTCAQDPCRKVTCNAGEACQVLDARKCQFNANCPKRAKCTSIDECATYPCKNGARCRDGPNSFVCDCTAGFTGPLCATNTNDCSTNPCQDRGVCVDGVNTFTCNCASGYTGRLCETNIDDCFPNNPCENGAACTDGVNTVSCSCPSGYTGQFCEIDIDDCSQIICLNGGTCVDGLNTFSCICPSGYGGILCQDAMTTAKPQVCAATCEGKVCIFGFRNRGCPRCKCVSDPCGKKRHKCNANQTCIRRDQQCGFATGCPMVAECVAKNINECDPNPCQNGATCVDENNAYTCECAPGFRGPNCGKNINECDPNLCQNGATCVDGNNAYTCECAPGFRGPNCGKNINDCRPNGCQNGATCNDLVDGFSCTCTPGFTGSLCDAVIDICFAHACENNAVCVAGVDTYTCECATGFTGDRCQTDIDECAPEPCQNGASCEDGPGVFFCQCLAGYTGVRCQRDINECSPNPCLNGAQCIDEVNTFFCECAPGYEGDLCENRTPTPKPSACEELCPDKVCPYGFRNKGCPRCKCVVDPCNKVRRQCRPGQRCERKVETCNFQFGCPMSASCVDVAPTPCEEFCPQITCPFGRLSQGCPRCICAPDPCQAIRCGSNEHCVRSRPSCEFVQDCPMGATCQVQRVTTCGGTLGRCDSAANCNFQFQWNHTQGNDQIEFVMSAAIGPDMWMAIGLSDDQNMANSDIILGYMDGKRIRLQDRWATGRALPQKDAQKDVNLVSGTNVNGITTFTFTRALNTNDPQDFELSDTSCPFIFLGTGPRNGNKIFKHSVTPVVTSQKTCLPCKTEVITTPQPVCDATCDFRKCNFGFLDEGCPRCTCADNPCSLTICATDEVCIADDNPNCQFPDCLKIAKCVPAPPPSTAAPGPCEATCKINCPHGFLSEGCPRCTCAPDPCKNKNCKNNRVCLALDAKCEFMTGCPQIARCRQAPPPTTAAPKPCEEVCSQSCPFGFLSEGCPRCTCAPDPCLTRNCASHRTCIAEDTTCEFQTGCPQRARCRAAPPTTIQSTVVTNPPPCEEVTSSKCKFGYVPVGCPRFICVGDPCKRRNCPPGENCVAEVTNCEFTTGCPHVARCQARDAPPCSAICSTVDCPFGYLNVGCPRCACAPDPCLNARCGSGRICVAENSPCDFDLGCPMVAKCRVPPPACDVTCGDMNCTFGFLAEGCPRCKCADDPCKSKTCKSGKSCAAIDDRKCSFTKSCAKIAKCKLVPIV